MTNIIKFSIGILLVLGEISAFAKQINLEKAINAQIKIPDKWTIETKEIKKENTFSYILTSENNDSKIELFFSRINSPLPNNLLKQVIAIKRSKIPNSSVIKTIKTKFLHGYYFSSENPIWTKKKKLRSYIKRFNTYVVLSFNDFMINATIRYNKENSNEQLVSLDILKSISIRN